MEPGEFSVLISGVWPGQRVSGDWSEMRQAEASEILPALIGGFSCRGRG